jgi:hypothetical protein
MKKDKPMKTKAIQLAVAVIAGVGLGVLAANYFAQRSSQPPSATTTPQTPALQAEPARREANSNTPTQPSPSPLAPGPSPLPPTQNPKPTTAVLSSVPVTLSIISLTETRSQITSPSAPTPQFSGLRLELVFSGELVNRSLKYGNLQISKAVDDAGTDLIIARAERPGGFVTNALPVLRPIETAKPPAGPAALPIPFLRPAATTSDGGTGVPPAKSDGTKTDGVTGVPPLKDGSATVSVANPNPQAGDSRPTAPSPSSPPSTQSPMPSQTVRLSIHLKSPPRTATALKELEGTLQFLQTSGTLEIKTPAVKTLEGKAIETPELQAARVSVGIQAARKSSFVTDPARALTLRISGLKDALLRVVFVDKDGKPLRTNNSWYSPSAGVEDWTYVTVLWAMRH